jgi:D-3-phosphoglycerate dehydrogenase
VTADGKADVLVVEDVWGPAFDRMAETVTVSYQPDLWQDRERLASEAAGSRAVVVRNRAQVDAALLDAAPRIGVVARAGVGLDNIDLGAASERGVVVVAARGANAASVAEHTLGLALALARGVVGHDRAVRLGRWDRTAGRELGGCTWGLLGVGATGLAVARLVSCMQVRVVGYDVAVTGDDEAVRAAGVRMAPIDAVISSADVLSVHLPATAQTSGLIDAGFISRMRPGSLLINVGRGEVLDEAALADALRSGHLGGAALDVRAQEPPPPGPLDEAPNVVFTPHVAGMTSEAQERVTGMLAEDLVALLGGGEARHAVGPLTRIATTRP